MKVSALILWVMFALVSLTANLSQADSDECDDLLNASVHGLSPSISDTFYEIGIESSGDATPKFLLTAAANAAQIKLKSLLAPREFEEKLSQLLTQGETPVKLRVDESYLFVRSSKDQGSFLNVYDLKSNQGPSPDWRIEMPGEDYNLEWLYNSFRETASLKPMLTKIPEENSREGKITEIRPVILFSAEKISEHREVLLTFDAQSGKLLRETPFGGAMNGWPAWGVQVSSGIPFVVAGRQKGGAHSIIVIEATSGTVIRTLTPMESVTMTMPGIVARNHGFGTDIHLIVPLVRKEGFRSFIEERILHLVDLRHLRTEGIYPLPKTARVHSIKTFEAEGKWLAEVKVHPEKYSEPSVYLLDVFTGEILSEK